MAYTIMQKIYKYSDEPTDNDFILGENIIEGLSVIKIGIQAPTGTKVKINDSEIIIGDTKTLELNEVINLNSVVFEEDDSLYNVIVDILYNKGGDN